MKARQDWKKQLARLKELQKEQQRITLTRRAELTPKPRTQSVEETMISLTISTISTPTTSPEQTRPEPMHPRDRLSHSGYGSFVSTQCCGIAEFWGFQENMIRYKEKLKGYLPGDSVVIAVNAAVAAGLKNQQKRAEAWEEFVQPARTYYSFKDTGQTVPQKVQTAYDNHNKARYSGVCEQYSNSYSNLPAVLILSYIAEYRNGKIPYAGIGKEFMKYVFEHKLGNVKKSNPTYNPNSYNKICVLMWEIHHDNFKKRLAELGHSYGN